jgi:hypothetical protein
LQSPDASQVIDVALDQGGVLRGQAVDAQGRPLVHAPLHARQQQQIVGTAVTDDNGYFAMAGLRGGVYQIEVAGSHATWRLWAARTAPPTALRAAMIVGGGDTVRGQWAGSRYFWPAVVLTGIIGAAIAIPIAVSNSNNDGS